MKIEFLEHSLRSSLKSMEPTPSSMFFSGARVCGAGCVWHEDLEAELEFVKRSSPKQAHTLQISITCRLALMISKREWTSGSLISQKAFNQSKSILQHPEIIEIKIVTA